MALNHVRRPCEHGSHAISTRHPFRVDTGFLVRICWKWTGFSPGGRREPDVRLISSKNLWILPKCIKDSVDLPDFVKESVPQIQILCTFQADFSIRNSHLYLARNP